MVIWIIGTIICLHARRSDFPWHLDQGDLLRERSIGVGVEVTFTDRGSYPGEPFHHGLLGVEPLGKHLLQIGGHRRRRFRYSHGLFLTGFRLGFTVFHVVGLGIFSLLVRCSVSLQSRRREESRLLRS